MWRSPFICVEFLSFGNNIEGYLHFCKFFRFTYCNWSKGQI